MSHFRKPLAAAVALNTASRTRAVHPGDLLTRLMLAVLLVIAQQAAYWHSLSHLDRKAPIGHSKQLPQSKACGQCGLSSQLGTGLLSCLQFSVSAWRTPRAEAHHSSLFTPSAPRRFRSRAPPILL